MRFRRRALVGAAALAAVVVPLTAVPAAASEYADSCSVVGLVHMSPMVTSRAYVAADWDTRYRMATLGLIARDTAADGHHAAVRLVTWQADGDVHYWPWHHYYGGTGADGMGQGTWVTSAEDSGGIEYAAVEGATMEGSAVLSHCISPKTQNPIW